MTSVVKLRFEPQHHYPGDEQQHAANGDKRHVAVEHAPHRRPIPRQQYQIADERQTGWQREKDSNPWSYPAKSARSEDLTN